MMRVGIIGAMDVEVTSIKERMTIDKIEQVGDNTYCLGKIGDTEVVVARCGIGKVNAAICATTMCVKYDITHILNTGIAGSLDNQINIGDIVVSTDAIYHDFSVEALNRSAILQGWCLVERQYPLQQMKLYVNWLWKAFKRSLLKFKFLKDVLLVGISL